MKKIFYLLRKLKNHTNLTESHFYNNLHDSDIISFIIGTKETGCVICYSSDSFDKYPINIGSKITFSDFDIERDYKIVKCLSNGYGYIEYLCESNSN